jgi:hypothetical protein
MTPSRFQKLTENLTLSERIYLHQTASGQAGTNNPSRPAGSAIAKLSSIGRKSTRRPGTHSQPDGYRARRDAARASRMLVTFAQAINSTRLTSAIRATGGFPIPGAID